MSEWLAACGTHGSCVEVKPDPHGVTLRVAAAPRQVVGITRLEWAAFLAAVKAGKFDNLHSADVV